MALSSREDHFFLASIPLESGAEEGKKRLALHTACFYTEIELLDLSHRTCLHWQGTGLVHPEPPRHVSLAETQARGLLWARRSK